jgi:hypothetical protein
VRAKSQSTARDVTVYASGSVVIALFILGPDKGNQGLERLAAGGGTEVLLSNGMNAALTDLELRRFTKRQLQDRPTDRSNGRRA